MSQANLLDLDDKIGVKARGIALSILDQVLQKKIAQDQVLERDAGFLSQDDRDKAFIRMLCATILRRKGQLDDLINRMLDQGKQPRPETLRHILYIGATQILFMDVPDHAAVDTSVQLAESHNLDQQKGFINAILRRMTSEGREWVKDQECAALNIPAWLYDQWCTDYGDDAAQHIAAASLAEASLDITVKNKGQQQKWAGALEASLLPTGSLRRKSGGSVKKLLGFTDGEWWVQDTAASIPVPIIGPLEGLSVIDLCAAPGGKTAQLAAAGAKVIAVDRSAKRLQLLRENMDRLGLADQVEIVVSDATHWQPAAPADVVLLDAPCSATGTIRRHPDLLHLKTAQDQDSLMNIQRRLLDQAASMVKNTGQLIYCTCSLQAAEGEYQIAAFLQAHPEFERVPITAEEIFGIDAITDEGDVRFFPYHLATHGGMDGFFISRLRKIG